LKVRYSIPEIWGLGPRLLGLTSADKMFSLSILLSPRLAFKLDFIRPLPGCAPLFPSVVFSISTWVPVKFFSRSCYLPLSFLPNVLSYLCFVSSFLARPFSLFFFDAQISTTLSQCSIPFSSDLSASGSVYRLEIFELSQSAVLPLFLLQSPFSDFFFFSKFSAPFPETILVFNRILF